MSDTTIQDEPVPAPLVKQEDVETAPEISNVPDASVDKKTADATEEVPVKTEASDDVSTEVKAQVKANTNASSPVTAENPSGGEPTTGDAKTADTNPGDSKNDIVKTEEGEQATADNVTQKDTASTSTSTSKPEHHRKFIKPPIRKNNIPISDNAEEIREQVEWYFGDANLPQDEHMWRTTGGPDNKPMDLAHLCTFSRMKHFQPYSAVVDALRESKTLTLSGETGKEVIQRKDPYVLQNRIPADRIHRTVYAKGFGDEDGLLTQIEIERLFKQYGQVNVVKLRRDDESGTFKGSVFAEFATVADATKFITADPKPTYKGKELVMMMKKAYTDMKSNLIAQGKMEASKKGPTPQYFEGSWTGKFKRGDRNGQGGFLNRPQNGRDKSDWKNRRNDQNGGFRGGRGGRGGGRGGRGRGGNRNGPANRPDSAVKNVNSNQPPVIKATEGDAHLGKKDKTSATNGKPATTNGKRSREDDGPENSEWPAKKVDVANASDGPATDGKPATNGKRAREDGGQDSPERPAKKVDTKTETTTAA